MLAGVGFLCLALAGCAPDTAGSPSRSGLTLRGALAGLDVVGSGGLEIGFNRAQTGVLDSVAKVEGRAPRPSVCPVPGRNAWRTRSGLVLVFEADRFVGWASADAMAGAGCEVSRGSSA